jgi:hypothetical protein
MKGKTIRELEAMKDELDRKNTYMHLFKNDGKLKRETIAEKTGKNIIFVYDQAKRDEEAHDGYCQKCKRESQWCKDRHHRALPHKDYGSVVTSSQVVGWREPIDNMRTGFARSGTCQKTFFDVGHLS